MKARQPKAPKIKPNARRRGECRAIFAALSEFVDGTLPARDCHELRKHLESCTPCVEYLESLKKTIDLCQAYKLAAAPPPSAVVRKAFEQALSKKPVRRAGKRRIRSPRLP